jgi:transketolase
LDEEAILKFVKKTGCVVTSGEHNKFGELGESVARLLITEYLAPQEFVVVNDSFGESETPDQLMTKYKLDPTDIVAAAQKVMERKK